MFFLIKIVPEKGEEGSEYTESPYGAGYLKPD